MASPKRMIPDQATAADGGRLRKKAADVARALDALAASGPTMSDAVAGKLAAEAKAFVRGRKK